MCVAGKVEKPVERRRRIGKRVGTKKDEMKLKGKRIFWEKNKGAKITFISLFFVVHNTCITAQAGRVLINIR